MVKKDYGIKSKKGWIRLIEVFVSILLITGVLLIIANRGNLSKEEISFIEISKKQASILRDIELNDSLREDILSAPLLPVEWEEFGANGLLEVRDRIIFLTPADFECEAKVCWINRDCVIEELTEKNIYAKSVVISANLNRYSPRQLKLFCVENEV